MNIQTIGYSFLKKCFPKLKIILCITLPLLVLVSCADDGKPRNTGIQANEELLEQIRQELEDKKQPILADEGDVFWTPSGSIWHTSSLCSSLQRSETILHGSIDEARTAGMEKECSRCADIAKLPDPNAPIQHGDVFWTENGSKWHSSQKCYHLEDADIVYHGTVEQAQELGKTGACSVCGRN